MLATVALPPSDPSAAAVFPVACSAQLLVFRPFCRWRPFRFLLHPPLFSQLPPQVLWHPAEILSRRKRLYDLPRTPGQGYARSDVLPGSVFTRRVDIPPGERGWDEISIVTWFRGRALRRRRTCLWLIRRRPARPKASRERRHTYIELCRGESIVMLTESRWLPIDRARRYGTRLGIANFSIPGRSPLRSIADSLPFPFSEPDLCGE